MVIFLVNVIEIDVQSIKGIYLLIHGHHGLLLRSIVERQDVQNVSLKN